MSPISPAVSLFPRAFRLFCLLSVWAVVTPANSAQGAQNFPEAISKIKPSIVGVGTYQATRNPAFQFSGTGFAVGDGTLIATNSHVVSGILDEEKKETLSIAIPQRGGDSVLRAASLAARDTEHDLVLLRIQGAPLPAASIADSNDVREGQLFGIIGFPIGGLLGLYPTTHRAMVSTITPVVLPQASARQLDAHVVSRMRTTPFDVFQLDATAYPGNSGSPMFDPDSGEVVAIVNLVFVKGTREAALTHPTGITYAIPASFLRSLLTKTAAAH